ncbi:ABC transporter ATP-binding protein [Hymenobacter saemangeumensis]|uniref:ABC transporter ATP-binding protein n=1 Tax=Hymenobacter saemangeumensis TaxID=1084522 RepID=A0ABP8INH1_9BACT
MAEQTPVVTVRNLSKKYCRQLRTSLWYGLRDIAADLWPGPRKPATALRRHEFWSLQDISFELNRGESLAIIGDNGAGKSTLLKLLNGLIKPDAGFVRMRGRVGALIELGVGLDPVLSGRENIFVRAALLGVARAQVLPLLPAIIEFTGLGEAIEMPVQFYSSGMVSRLAFAVAAHLHPDVLLVDEVLAVGDFDFQRKCINHMMGYLAGGGSIILVSHVPHHIQAVCQRGLVLEKGAVAFSGSATEALDYYFAHQQLAPDSASSQAAARELTPLQPVRIEQLIVTSASEQIAPGADLTLHLTYRALHELEGCGWAFFIYTNEGAVCITSGYFPESFSLQAGAHTLSCCLRRSPLTAGEYQLRAAIYQRDTLQPLALLGWEDAPVPLRVEAAASLEKNVQAMVRQLISVEIVWNQQPL